MREQLCYDFFLRILVVGKQDRGDDGSLESHKVILRVEESVEQGQG